MTARSRRRRRWLLALVGGALVLAACGADDDGSTSLPTVTARPADGAAAIVDRTFIGTGTTVDGEPMPLVADGELRVRVDADGALSASGGCNSIGGAIDLDALDEGVLRADGPLHATEMACFPDELMDQDAWLGELLVEGLEAALDDDGDRLELRAGTTVLHLIDQRATRGALPLATTVWTVETTIEVDVATATPTTSAATLVLRDDGTAQIETGCNSGSTTWERAGDQLELGAIGLTRKACPGEVGALEQRVVAVLDSSPLTIEHDGDRLVLRDAAGGRALAFVGAVLVDDGS